VTTSTAWRDPPERGIGQDGLDDPGLKHYRPGAEPSRALPSLDMKRQQRGEAAEQ
jgi:hypothetical protein